MKLNDEEGKKLVAGMDAMRDLSAELDAIDYENDPDALSKQYEIMDLMMTFSMGMGPLRKKTAIAKDENDVTQDKAVDNAE